MNKLEEILLHKRREVEERKESLPLRELKRRVGLRSEKRFFREALKREKGVALIAEIKKASPSVGLIRKDFRPAELAQAYEKGGAHALSVLTDRRFFQGCLEYLEEARNATRLPCLRKDFVIDEYQIWEARLMEADALLLIVAALKIQTLKEFVEIAAEANVEVLMEVHDAREMDVALELGAAVIGINNRNLQTFKVDLAVTEMLVPRASADRILVSESGIHHPADVKRMKDCGIHAVLVGESLMRQPDVERAARELMNEY